MKTVTAYELLDHGIDHADYFQGCGVAFTDFDDVATGCGSNPAEAIDDAIEQLACGDWDVEGLNRRMLQDENRKTWPKRPAARGDSYYYVSIRVR